ncbi:MAG: HAMP domain-containing protein [Acidobacteriota bacterium]|nr:HAMP domain-containing protein [Acidobacteriota bacterium]
MSLTESQLLFASEFLTLVVTASFLTLVALRAGSDLVTAATAAAPVTGSRPRPPFAGRRGLVEVALVVLGGAAFVHGSLLVTGAQVRWVGAARLAAAATIALALPHPLVLGEGRRSPVGLLGQAATAAFAGAGAVEALGGPGPSAEILLVVGSAAAAAALLAAARHSIALRVAASTSVTLLIVVVVLALSLSAVISSRLESEELSRLSGQASFERSAVTASAAVAAASQALGATLSQAFSGTPDDPLSRFAAGSPAEQADAASAIRSRLLAVSPTTASVLAYTDPSGGRLVSSPAAPDLAAGGLAAVVPASCAAGRQGLFDLSGVLYLAASTPVCDGAGGRLGAAVAARTLDAAYLAGQVAKQPQVALALLQGSKVLAAAGISEAAASSEAARLRVGPGQSETAAVGERYAAAVGLTVAAGRSQSPAVLLLSDRVDTVRSTRDQLLRNLFLIAFGGTVVALGLAVFTGDRITAGLRRLTRASTGIAAGDTKVRAGVAGDDEVAVLGRAFDAMVDSVAANSAALRDAVADEVRLRNRLQAVVAGMSDALVATDADGLITEFNRAATWLTGRSESEAVGRPFAAAVRLVDEHGAAIDVVRGEAPTGPDTLSAVVLQGDVPVPVAVSRGRLHGPGGESAGTVLVLRDMRREQEIEQMKTEFLSRIGHELRTPLTGVLGYADLLAHRAVPEERARAWHAEILQSSKRLLRIVEMLEFFASEGAGRSVLRPELVDARAVVAGVAAARSEAVPPGVSIGRRLPDCRVTVEADPRWLSLAVDELVDNAVKFSPEGGRILLRVAEVGGEVEISVSDHGIGMSDREQEEVFGAFVQGDPSDTRRFGGLGLGLAVVRRVVEGHGGAITCRSKPGAGTTVTIVLTRRDRPPDGDDDSFGTARSHDKDGRGPDGGPGGRPGPHASPTAGPGGS